MPLQEMYYIAEMVVGVAVIISIGFVAIELRQNTYMMKKSMADQRQARLSWFHETMVTNNEFRHFQQRMSQNFEQLTDDEIQRAFFLGTKMLIPGLNELVAYFDGQLSDHEFENLKWNLTVAKGRPQSAMAYDFLKSGYPKEVQKFWEELEASKTPEIADARVIS